MQKTQKNNNIQQLHNHGPRREYTDSRCSRGLGVIPGPSHSEFPGLGVKALGLGPTTAQSFAV